MNPPAQAATISSIALHAGVSKTTVSRVLNNKPDVDPETAERVRASIRALAYVPSRRAVALSKGQALCVGLLVPTLNWPLMLDIVRGVAEGVETSGYALMLYSMTRGDESLRDFTEQIVRARQIDGLLVVIPTSMLDYLSSLYREGLPMILVDDRGLKPGFPFVAPTNFEGGYAAGRHLLDIGRRRLGIVNGPVDFGCNRDRVGGFRKALDEAGVVLDERLVRDSDFTEDGGSLQVESILDSGVEFDGLFFCNDQMALGGMRMLQQRGLRIPEGVAVVGFDDIPTARFTTPSLTTIRQPLYEMGYTAATLLIESLKSGTLPAESIHLPTSLVVRGSTGG